MVATKILKDGYDVISSKFNQMKKDCVKLTAEYTEHRAYIRKIANHIDDTRVNPLLGVIREVHQNMYISIRSKLDISISMNAKSLAMRGKTSVRHNQAAANAVKCVKTLCNHIKSVLYRCRTIKSLVDQELEICRQHADFDDQYGKFIDALTFEC
jgi:hypothetical protein